MRLGEGREELGRGAICFVGMKFEREPPISLLRVRGGGLVVEAQRRPRVLSNTIKCRLEEGRRVLRAAFRGEQQRGALGVFRVVVQIPRLREVCRGHFEAPIRWRRRRHCYLF